MPNERIRQRLSAIAIAAIVVLLFALDLATPHLNTAPAYVLPLFLFARALGGRRVAAFALMLSMLTIAGYLLEPKSPGTSWHEILYSFQVVNRLITIVALLLVAFCARRWVRSRAWMEKWGDVVFNSDESRRAYQEVMEFFAGQFAATASLLIICTLAIADLVTPANYNIAILYCLPVAMCSALRSRALLWGEAIATIALSLLCYKFGVQATSEAVSHPVLLEWILYNRFLAIATVAILTLILDRTMPAKWAIRAPSDAGVDPATINAGHP